MIGEYTYGRPTVLGFNNTSTLHVGKFCSIASNVTIYLGVEHQTKWITTYPFVEFPDLIKNRPVNLSKGDVVIGNDVWIADGALILSGVTIGDGAVIGARSVVAKDIKPYEIVAGNPAKHIRFRFNPDQIGKLMAIKWWYWDIEKIKDNFDLILNNNIDLFIERHS